MSSAHESALSPVISNLSAPSGASTKQTKPPLSGFNMEPTMTSLMQLIRDDALAARKAAHLARDPAVKAAEGDRATFLITLSAEAARKGKDDGNRESTNDEVVSVVKKFIDNANLTLSALGDKAPAQRARVEAEILILKGYMPAQVDAAAVTEAITEIVASLAERGPKQMGLVMSQLTARFGSSFDKAAASAQVRQALA